MKAHAINSCWTTGNIIMVIRKCKENFYTKLNNLWFKLFYFPLLCLYFAFPPPLFFFQVTVVLAHFGHTWCAQANV